jgi:transposase
VYAASKVKAIGTEDTLILDQWRNSNDHQKWQKAVVIQGSYEGRSVIELADKTELALETLEKWLTLYKNKGIAGLLRKPMVFNDEIRKFLKHKRDCLMELIHQKPKMHGFNRTTWTLQTLATAYIERYNIPISAATVSLYLEKEGFSFKRAVERLSCNDPDYRAKVDRIKYI